jgi:PGF-pre-PGF domain-containing protein/PGF-CTERM protein
VTFDAGPSTDDIEVVEYRWEFGDGETANTTDPTVNHKYRVMTRTNATVTVVDGGGQTDTDAVNVTIAPGIKDQPRDPEDFELNYVGPRPGEWLDEGPPKSREELERAAELVGVGIRPTEPHDELTLGVTTAVEPTEDVPSIPDGATTLGDYVAVDAPATFAGDARVQFRIEKETLSELQVGTESVSILHGKNGAEGWDRPDTAVVGEDDEHYTVAAESDGFSTFVVVLADPGNDETEPSPETDSPEGEQSETTTTEEPREDPTPTERATPPQNASNTTETGSEDPSTEPDESTPPTDGQSTASDDGFELPQPGFGPLVALLALVLGLLAVRRRS